MRRRWAAALALQCLAATAPAAPVCAAASGPQTAALVELYTSEGCSSCPPADAWLNAAPGARYRPGQVVALALHVPYWDDLGWKDALAQPAFAARQSRLVAANGHRTVYTPHFFVSGSEVGDWRGGLDGAIGRVAAQPAVAHITLDASLARPGVLTIDAVAQTAGDASALYIAVTEDHLIAAIGAGENRGATLHHEHVVRALLGPLAISGGRLAAHRELALASGWQAAQLGVAAFVAETRSGRVLQAVAMAPCRHHD